MNVIYTAWRFNSVTASLFKSPLLALNIQETAGLRRGDNRHREFTERHPRDRLGRRVEKTGRGITQFQIQGIL